MIIRPATRADLPALVRLGLAFAQSPVYAAVVGETRPETILTFLEALFTIYGEALYIPVAEEADGRLVGGLVLVDALNPMSGTRYADETAWWVDPAARGRLVGPLLLDAAETWATARGLPLMKMVAPVASPAVGRFYTRRGYAPLETAYLRSL